MVKPEIIIIGEHEYAQISAEIVADILVKCLAHKRIVSLCLTGGSTPRKVYENLSQSPVLRPCDWERVFFFWGDERLVPPSHPDSNYRMASESLLDRLPIARKNIYRIKAELGPEAGAAEYEDVLQEFFCESVAAGAPAVGSCFDLVLLGVGGDAHTASLFPATPALSERVRWVVANWVPMLNAWRITLTPVLLNSAATIVFLVAGEEKAKAVHQILNTDYPARDCPAKIILPTHGRLVWVLDEKAAGHNVPPEWIRHGRSKSNNQKAEG